METGRIISPIFCKSITKKALIINEKKGCIGYNGYCVLLFTALKAVSNIHYGGKACRALKKISEKSRGNTFAV